MAIPMLRVAVISHSQSQPLIHSISVIDETARRRKRVALSSSSELNPVIRSEVSLCVGTCLIPHPNKVDRGGEDAFFLSDYNGGVIAVADGVSGWAEEDVDPSLFPRELMDNASNYVEDDSATVIVAMLEKNGTLKIANVGDCGLRVIRNGHVIFSTSPQEHYFDCPFQLSSERVGQTYLDATVCNVELIEGDTIVMGSDGLFDNVFDHEIIPTIVRYKDVAEAAKALANLASSHAIDSKFDSPYSLEARSRGFDAPLWKKILGMTLTGGKLDDITVIVGQVVSS
ncbi:probable protein phosphatase 2C 26 isoform X2 [Abrus precatorius]|uniref:Protein phosphatase n=1 Tax=Abrus precatorius TaxID=3816 RepID=A0A8B8JXQ2_ABRPR|nr:probable protein phosphatase 2C 26 isoform X2 [Abrus precatorius]